MALVVMFNATDRLLVGAILEPIKKEFLATDTQMGLLAGLWFAFFYAAGSAEIRMQFLGLEMPQVMIFFILMCFFSSWIYAASVAALSNIILAHQRAVANAVYVVFYTVLGFGIGPVSVGMLSDALAKSAGQEGLRYALAILTSAMIVSMLFYAKALKPYLAANK